VIAILFSILFQSFDSYGHYKNETTESKCVHESASKQEITHQHHPAEHCFICKFSFSAAVTSIVFGCKSQNLFFENPKNFYFSAIFKPFPESSNLLRGPPFFNV
jgi:hypothetical protein